MADNATANFTCSGSTESSGSTSPIAWVFAVVATLIGACLLALSMVMQRYALAYPEPRVPFGRFRVRKNVLWAGGILLYATANGFKIIGFNLASMTVLASVFTSLLVFNLIFAHWLLGEEITAPKVAGAVLILVGASICTASVPSDAPTAFEPEEYACLLESGPPSGYAFVATAILGIVISSLFIIYYERSYAREPASVAPDNEADLAMAVTPVVASDAGRGRPPAWLDAAMAVIYPATLGIDEAVSDLFVRGYSSMLTQCSGVDDVSCAHYALAVAVAGGVIAGGMSIVYMRIAFARYPTTVALPIEYGALNAGNVCVGLLFYQEHRFMDSTQLALALSGTAVILIGIAVGRIPARKAVTPFGK